MSTPEKPSHWKFLADLLGAPLSEANPTPPKPPATPIPSPASAEPRQLKPVRPAAAKQPKADWRSLAGTLGLGGSPAPTAQPPREDEPVAPQDIKAFPRKVAASKDAASPGQDASLFKDKYPRSEEEFTASDEAPSEPRALAASHWDAPADKVDELFDPLEMPATAFVEEVADAVDLDVDDASRAEADSVTEERHRRRRRRRRRGRRPEPSNTGDEPRATEPTAGSENSQVEPVADFVEDELPLAETPSLDTSVRDADDSDSAVEKESEEERPRRRRRRRRRGRRDDDAAPREKISEPAPTTDDAADDDDALAEVLADADEEFDGDEKGGEAHPSHKKIPSWQEAIEVVVANNISQHAKHPGAGPRGRGRRDR